MTLEIRFNPTPDPDNWVIKKWFETPKGEFIDIGVYGQPYKKVGIVSSEITEVWIDEANSLSKKQVEYLTGRHLKLMALSPKKQHKPKHKVPFWAQDWRSKK